MARLHIVLVCHTESWDKDGWRYYDEVQPNIDTMVQRVADATGKKPKMTYCVTDDVLAEKRDDLFRFVEEGHEVGIHSHLPGNNRPLRGAARKLCAYKLDEDGVLNQDKMAGPFREIAIGLGLPAPATHVSGACTFQRTMIAVLEKAGYSVDCSLAPQAYAEEEEFDSGFVVCDNRRRSDLRPYRPSSEDPWIDGDSSIIELPINGHFCGGYAGTEKARIPGLMPQYLLDNYDQQLEHVQRRLAGTHEVDVFHALWHHLEFANVPWCPPGHGDAKQARAEKWLMQCAALDGVVFSTARDAAEDLKKSGL